MQTLIKALLFALAATHVQNGHPPVTFRSEEIGVTLEVPFGWEITETEDQKFLIVSPAIGEWDLSGMPPAPYPWLSIHKSDARVCPPKTSDKPRFDRMRAKEGPYWEALICQPGVEIMLGYWEKDPTHTDRREELERILASVRSIR